MWTKALLKSKARAWLIHFGISALIFLPILYVLWVRWFPPPLFFTDGGTQGLAIMIPVDLVLGPLLTFLVFNPAKSRREMTMDFSIIGIVQAAALVYGGMMVEKRSIDVVLFFNTHFVAVNSETLRKQGVGSDQLERLGPGPVRWAAWHAPEGDEGVRAMAMTMDKGISLQETFELMDPLGPYWSDMKAQAMTAEKAGEGKADLAKRLAALQADHPGPLYFFHHSGEFRGAIVALDESGKLVGSVVPR